jgi:two-component system sensor histidine kinase KdpD
MRLAADLRVRRVAGYLLATLGMAGLVLVLRPFRDSIAPSTAGWAFLGMVVLSSAVGGLGPGMLASFVAFACSNYFFVVPYHTFEIARGEDVVMLFVLLGVSGLISFLLARARARAEFAEARAAELQLQQDLVRALVEPAPGTENYQRVLEMLVAHLGFRRATLLAQGDEGLEELVRIKDDRGEDDELPSQRAEQLPLVVGRRNLGLLALSGRAQPIDPPTRRTLRALSDQLALVLERDRLLRVVVRAERERLRASSD